MRHLCVGDNEPYAGGLDGDCMDRHAVRRGLPHTLVEMRQDLISDAGGHRRSGRTGWRRHLKQ
jgi:predicted N-formylglutamate amidohydrolase